MHHRRLARAFREQLAADPHRGAVGRPHVVALRSADPALRFEAKLFVECQWSGAGAAPPAAREIAAEGIIRRAEKVSQDRTLTECSRLHGELAIALLRWELVEDTKVRARAHCASVTADPELASAVATREEAARRQVLLSWQHEQREHDATRLRSLIVDPLRATAWWFADNQDKIEELSEVAKVFLDLRAALGPAREEDTAGRVLDEFLDGVDSAEGLRLQLYLQRVFGERGRSDLVERIDPVLRDAAGEPGPS
ncbi:hypothetical protein F1721_13060 [Saccharopolyspora hirsuta]|uniref:Uncharacterized protein n=1 Tax=Saccharopolyspora hirsuta TaxID=1837 RepID=A0A5M7C289_SACHI|nr:hypothetical protein [Saccharopolyspora hirsuta]KAA5834587.1 hypothetical protein F1721_13060 [Saccharopolyspora hirsuta]